ncbi:MAG: hypothetical protein PSX36_15980 [bacterium]|nr:hypothetical protein [bacterium]
MNRILILVTSIFVLASVSCKSQKNPTGPQATKEPTVYKGVTDQACAVEVAFGSYGSGIDAKALDKVMAAITSRKLKHTATNIGREGETRICLPLKELKGKKKTAFINELKKIAKEGQLVSVSIR